MTPNRRGHDRWVGARPRRLHPDHRKIDIGHRRHRQEVIGNGANQEQANAEQRGADRPANEGLGDRGHYGVPPAPAALAVLAIGGEGGRLTGGVAFSKRRLMRSSAR
jgi:hypothetical protein